MKKMEAFLNECVDNSAGCVCIEYQEGECLCSKEKKKTITRLLSLFNEIMDEALPKAQDWENYKYNPGIKEHLYMQGRDDAIQQFKSNFKKVWETSNERLRETLKTIIDLPEPLAYPSVKHYCQQAPSSKGGGLGRVLLAILARDIKAGRQSVVIHACPDKIKKSTQ